MRRILFLALCVAFIGTQAFAEIKVTGDVETNTTFTKNAIKIGGEQDTTVFEQAGRVLGQFYGKTEANGLFAEGQGQALLQLDGTAAVDDAWVKVGTAMANLQVGRWEGTELFKVGEDVLIATANAGGKRYGANAIRGRSDMGFALNVTPNEMLGVQILAAYGSTDADGSGTSVYGMDNNTIGVRPAVSINAGMIKANVGMEYVSITPQDDDASDDEASILGFGGEVVIAPMPMLEVGLSGAYKTYAQTIAGVDSKDETTLSLGAVAKIMTGDIVIGLGGFYTKWEQDAAELTEMQFFGVVEYKLLETTWVKFAGSYATADDSTDDDSQLAFRLRINHAL